ncbi:MUSTANG 3 [Hibiscus trionum]|uniref:MUSTANG 3 n=1 Tax=Hibiscus trionum TaxID=183268 RepID=A0A9W7MIF7_HIBTR|nr:MUSTANG 3 [Hibiscus trionum]
MEDHTFVVGQEFPDVKAFRIAIKEAAIAQHFELRIIKSDLIRYFAKCATEGCPWRIRAVKLPNAPTFTIRSLEGTHTCGKNAQNGHHQASVDWIVSFIEERLRDNINYKPKDILHDIHKKYGIIIPYKQAWRAKERGLAAIYGSSEEGYCLLPAFCEQITKTNPGSIAEVFTTGADNRFQRLFVSFYASIHGFLNGCLPIVGLGGIQLKNKYLGTLLSATSFDADGGLFPLAFGVVDTENDDNWIWFLSELHKALAMNSKKMPQLTFLSGGQIGALDVVRIKFPNSFHALCMRHLSESICREFKNSRLVHLLWKAAYATTTSAFKEKMAEIEEVSPEAAKWMQQFPSSRWALLYFEGTRYGHLSSNIEEFNRWIFDARELPIIQVIEVIHSKLMSEFEDRRIRSHSWVSVLSPTAETRMQEVISRASTYQVLRSDEVEFEVISAERSDIVNIGKHSCSCRDWQLYGIPCSHAAAALLSCRKDVYAFTEKCFTVANYQETYSEEIHPIPGKIEWRKLGEVPSTMNEDAQVVRPPKFRRPPGRPEKKRICLVDLNSEKHMVHCSRCNQTGHYKTTCKAADIVKGIEQL